MKYNFDKIIDRRSTNSLKWNVNENELPMWVWWKKIFEIKYSLQQRRPL